MTAQTQREIVIEFEKVQTIRKRAKTVLTNCIECRFESDGVSLIEAADLFETSSGALFKFIRDNNCHYTTAIDDRIYLCVPSLLECMQRQRSVRQLSSRGELL